MNDDLFNNCNYDDNNITKLFTNNNIDIFREK